MTAEQLRSPASEPDVANPGLARPPLVYLVALLVGVGLDLVRPARWLPAEVGAWVGVPIMIAALALFFSSTRRFRAAGHAGSWKQQMICTHLLDSRSVSRPDDRTSSPHRGPLERSAFPSRTEFAPCLRVLGLSAAT